MLSNKNISESL